MDTDAILKRVDDDLDAALERLFALLAIPSISTDPAFDADCRRAARWVADDLSSLGLAAAVRETQGKPVVLAKSAGAATGHGGKPHILFYGHYDVQPVDPLELWNEDPFAPRLVTRPDGTKVIVARGACDDKGQFMSFVEALRAIVAIEGRLPAPLTVLIEGEEESGSPSLPGFLADAGEELKADAAFICDTAMWNADTPAIALSLRGLVAQEVIVKGPSRDLHSGQFGGAAQNPNRVLARIIAELHDETGRVTIQGFYDGVEETDPATRENWDGLGADASTLLGPVGLSQPAGEVGRSVLEQVWARPTCEVNGMSGGYTGQGFKTVIPAEARAKISFRLVGGQDPFALRAALKEFVRERLPQDCSAEFIDHGAGPATTIDPNWPMLSLGRQALEAEWGRAPAMVGMGGSIPIVNDFKHKLGMDSMMIGFALEDDNVHSPNEKYNLTSFHKGIRSWVRVLTALESRFR